MKTRPAVKTSRSEKSFWTVKEAARYLNVHYVTIYSWITDQGKTKPCKLIGDPPPVRRFGRNCIRLPIEEFKAWAETFKQGQS
jgi:Helix-turn-helix domain